MYALIQNDTVAQFPYSETQLRRDNPRTSFPRKLTLPVEGQNGTLVAVVEAGRPTVTDAQVLIPDATPTLVDGVWTLGWTVRDKTAAEVLASLPYKTAAEAKAAMVKWIDGLTAQVMDQYPRAVQARWSIEEAAARAVKHDVEEADPQKHIATADQLALVTNEGAAKGRTPEEHADAIIANADRFRDIADQINTLFLATDAALEAATDPAQYEGILDAAIAQAAPLAEAYGLTA